MNWKIIAILSCVFSSMLVKADPPANQATFNGKLFDLQAKANAITIINGPLIVVGLGPFPAIIAQISSFTNLISAAAGTIYTFDPLFCQTFNILTGKAGLFSALPFIGGPVENVLLYLKSSLTAYFSGIEQNDETNYNQMKATEQLQCLEATINAYHGLLGL